MSFVNDYINNRCTIEDIDNYIDEWHDMVFNDIHFDFQLHEYLGLTQIEYFKFIDNYESLNTILQKYVKLKEFVLEYRNKPILFLEEYFGIKLSWCKKLILNRWLSFLRQ